MNLQMATVFGSGGGHKAVAHVGEGDGELQAGGGGCRGEGESTMDWRAHAVALHIEVEGKGGRWWGPTRRAEEKEEGEGGLVLHPGG
jgi:hypothetical protein